MDLIQNGERYGFWDEANNTFYEFPSKEDFMEFILSLNVSE